MTQPIYLATAPEDLFVHLVGCRGDRISLFTEEWFYSEKIENPSLEKVKSAFKKGLAYMGQQQARAKVRSYYLNLQGMRDGSVISVVSFPVLVCVKPV